MIYTTRDFGEIEITENEIISFVQPPFGFDEYKKYTLIYDQEIGRHIVWLQSLEDSSICFILFDPSPLSDIYKPELPSKMDSMLGEGDFLCWTVAVVSDDFQKISVNLKSPIIINTHTNLASQIILEQDYPVRFPLAKEDKSC